MAEARVERRLAAILAADVVGYSRLMGNDEEGTLAALKACRRELIEPKIAEHRGRIVKLTGDGALVEFASAVNATRCAMEIQHAMAERNAGIPEDRRIEFRIGINVGDIIIDEGDIYGDGVNIAARVESLASPGAICLSENTYKQIKGKLAVDVGDMGEQQLKNITQPVRVYDVRLDDVPAHTTLAKRDKPSIAVLPFQNISRDPEQEYFADGMVEDIITSLSKVRHLFVIARNSTFTYKNRAVDVRQVARELNVQYVLEGSVQRSGDRLRVTAQLIEAATGNHVWAERYDRSVHDVFDVQDEITKEIVLALSVELTDGERARVFSRSTRSLEAWLAAMRGFDHWAEGSPKGIREARAYFERAALIDPNYMIAWAFIGWTHYTEVRFGFSADPRASLAKAAELAEKCIAMSPEDPQAHGIRAGVWVVQGRFEDAIKECEIAIAGAPSDAYLWCVFGRVLVCAGNAARGEQAMREAMQLNPFHPSYYRGILGNALEELGRNTEAIEVLTESVRREPDYFSGHLRLASLYGLGDQIEAAKAELATALRINPKFTMAMAEAFYASSNRASSERFKLGLRKAGLSD
jgi:TolB-like protein/class 3 adenylate cyclase